MTTSTTLPPRIEAAREATATRIGAACGLVGIALVAAGFSLVASAQATFHSPDADVVGYYTGADGTTTFAGGLVEAVGLLLFLPIAAALASRL